MKLNKVNTGMRWRGIVAGSVLVVALLAVGIAGFARNSARDRESLEAAFIYQFTQYVEWPSESFESTNDHFGIGVVGDAELYERLVDVVANKQVGNRPLDTFYVDHPSELPSAQIVYIGSEVVPEVTASDSWPQPSALTVSGAEGFTRAGGIIRIYEQDQRLRIEINIDAAERSQLKISSKLLGLATVVRDEAQ